MKSNETSQSPQEKVPQGKDGQAVEEVKTEELQKSLSSFKPSIPQTQEEIEFGDCVTKALPLLERIDELLSDNRLSLKSQKYRIDNNFRTIQDQEKTIASHQALIEGSKNQGSAIIANAETKAKEIEKGVQMRIAQANHLEREAKKKFEESERILWEAKNKRG